METHSNQNSLLQEFAPSVWAKVIRLVEAGFVPDFLVRAGIRELCRQRISSFAKDTKYISFLKSSPLAVHTDLANRQHYEVPAEFFKIVLGPALKYSCGYWGEGIGALPEAELAALDLTVKRAKLQDGMKILELGCGWGSLSLHMAKKFPGAQILSVSNSKSQKAFIDSQAGSLGLENLEIRTLDLSHETAFEALGTGYDRVVSVEMFEHFRNYERLFSLVKDRLRKGGKLFVHIFSHKSHSYVFEPKDATDWMSDYFFSGGQMPSHDLFVKVQQSLWLEEEWKWNGLHYQKTSEAWLDNMDRQKSRVLELFEQTYGAKEAKLWFNRWRLFFLAVAESFGFKNGQEWGVSHYLFGKNDGPK